MKAVIGALRAVLGLDSTAFEKGLNRSQKMVVAFNRDFQKMAKEMDKVGQKMSLALSAPIGIAMGLTVKAAADFEEGMNKVKAATQGTADEMARLEEMARKIGQTSAFSATEAASAMEGLAKNGLNVAQILGGAADATVKLAAANGAQLGPAADVVTDVMQQFGKSASDLDGVVNQVTGTLIASKLGFDDYRLAIGQAGGVAGKVGVNFEDFNAALAATSSSFASGSDAGTSFKTFLTRLVPQSDEAKGAMQLLGLSFFDAKGNMLSMEQIAERLKKALSGLSQQSRIEGVTKIFGTDAMRTALSLAEQGAAGIAKMRAEIEKTSAADQAKVRLQGFNGAVRELKGAFEGLQIAIGKSGLLESKTRMVKILTDITRALASLNPEVLKFGTILAGIAAAAGPTFIALSAVAKVFGNMAVAFTRLAPAAAGVVAAFLPMAGVALAVGLAAAAIAIFGDKITVFTEGGVAVSLLDILRAIGDDFRNAGDMALAAGQAFANGLQMIGDALNNIVPGLGDFTKNLGEVLGALDIGDTLFYVFVGPLDAALRLLTGLIAATIVAFRTLGPAISDLLVQLANIVAEKMTVVVNAGISAINYLRQQIGKADLPALKFEPWTNENAGAAEKAGKVIAMAFAQGVSGSIVKETIERLKQASVGKAIGRAVQEQIDKGNPNADFMTLNDPKGSGGSAPAGGPGGGRVIDFGTGGDKKSAAEKLKEYIDSIAREAELLKMTAKLRAEAEALDKAEAIAKEGKIKLTDADTEAIKRNVAAQLAAKDIADERTRLEALAKTTIEGTRTAQEKYNEALKDLDKLLALGLINSDTYKKAQTALKEELSKNAEGLQAQLEQVSTAITDAAKEAAHELLETDKTFGDVLVSMAKRFSQFALQIFLFEPLFKALGDSLKSITSGFMGGMGGAGGGGGGIFGQIGGWLGSFFGGGGSNAGGFATLGSGAGSTAGYPNFSGMAKGGDVSPGRWYQINERGIEAFVPDVPGKIMTNSDLRNLGDGSGGGTVVNQSFVIKTPDADSFRRSQRQMQRRMQRIAGVSQ